MIPIKLFQQRLQEIKQQYNWLEKAVENFVYNNPLVEANYAVPKSELTQMLRDSMVNLFLSLNQKFDLVVDLADYYFFEMNFGGVIESDNKEYNLCNDTQLYQYLLTL